MTQEVEFSMKRKRSAIVQEDGIILDEDELEGKGGHELPPLMNFAGKVRLIEEISIDIPDPLAYYPPQEATVKRVREGHQQALDYYAKGNLLLAEQYFTNTLKNNFSSTSSDFHSKFIDVKEELLDAMYHLGEICLQKAASLNNYTRAAAIFRYCGRFSKKYSVELCGFHDSKSGKADYDYFQQKAYKLEQAYLKKHVGKKLSDLDLSTRQKG